jgi:hypothetical protein
MTVSTDHFFQELPHEDATAPHHHLVEDLSFTTADLERLLEGKIHEDVNTNHNSFNLASSVKFYPQFLRNIFVEIGRVALLGQWAFDCALFSCHFIID